MLERSKQRYAASREGEGGFTLIELLVVIIILGILAAVVVFAVGGVGDKGQSAACKIDTRTIRTAEEAFAATPASNGKYTDMNGLKNGGFLSELSTYHDVGYGGVVSPAPAAGAWDAFKITILKTACGGNVGDTVDPNATPPRSERASG